MFGHKSSAVDRVVQGTPRRLDSVAAGALLLGMGNWLSMSLFNFDAVKAVAGPVTHVWIEGGDHGLRKRDAEVAEAVREWVLEVC